MRKIRVVAELNIDDEMAEHTDSLYEAMVILTEQVENAIVQSEAIECEAFGDPILNTVFVEEERITRAWEKWNL